EKRAIRMLSPLSGHYRSFIDHFKSFEKGFEERGADLSKLDRAEVALWIWCLRLKKCVSLRGQSQSGPPSSRWYFPPVPCYFWEGKSYDQGKPDRGGR
ncbi:uncharacterized protein EI90DRAFT_3061026, partial [Cantharellus anzutake]|uniref:uncharacterized protein n=1 Tax=Cantharellus anzutake TaxID=1750568 RepID=UPI0019088261